MALTQNKRTSAQDAGAVSAPDKQIVAQGTGSNTLLYSVPDGRKFVGWCSNESWNNGSYWISLEKDGIGVRHYNGFSAAITQYWDGPDSVVLTLLAGTVVKIGNGGTAYVFGVESDA
tara:strand:+ start:3567 stop:3917 length:351 start_codon:yes stop_codon:yes gene_type:complete